MTSSVLEESYTIADLANKSPGQRRFAPVRG